MARSLLFMYLFIYLCIVRIVTGLQVFLQLMINLVPLNMLMSLAKNAAHALEKNAQKKRAWKVLNVNYAGGFYG